MGIQSYRILIHIIKTTCSQLPHLYSGNPYTFNGIYFVTKHRHCQIWGFHLSVRLFAVLKIIIMSDFFQSPVFVHSSLHFITKESSQRLRDRSTFQKKIFSLNNACLAEQQYCWSFLVRICLRLATVTLVLHSFKMFKDTLDVPSISMIYKTCWYFIFISMACISTMSYIANNLLLGLIIAVLIAQNPEIIWLCTHNNIIHWALTCGIHIDDSNLNPTNHNAGSGCQ